MYLAVQSILFCERWLFSNLDVVHHRLIESTCTCTERCMYYSVLDRLLRRMANLERSEVLYKYGDLSCSNSGLQPTRVLSGWQLAFSRSLLFYMSAKQVSSQSTPKHHPVTFCDVVTPALAARSHSDHHDTGMPRLPPGKGAVRTPAHDQRPALHIATFSPSTAARLGASRPISSVPDTPSARTGPPRSLSYQFTPSSSPIGPHFTYLDGHQEIGELFENDFAEHPQSASLQPRSQRRQSTFRGALELIASNIDKDSIDRKGKARETRGQDDGRIPTRWLEPSMEGKPTIIFQEPQGSEQPSVQDRSPPRYSTVGFVKQDDLQSKSLAQTSDIYRSQTHPPPRSIKRSAGSEKWGKLRALIPSVIRPSPSTPTAHAVTPPEVNIIDELITGGLSNLMLGLWFERDDKGHRRVPVLLHRLRIRISDSLHPLHAHKAVFRIECEYANGAARWVIYRQLRDFISLHTHYTISNAFSSQKDKLPEFPRTSMSIHPHSAVILITVP